MPSVQAVANVTNPSSSAARLRLPAAGRPEFLGAGLSRPYFMHSTFVLLSIAFLPIALGNAWLIYDSHVCIHSALVIAPAPVQTNLLREESRDGQAQKEESNEEDHQEEGEEKEEEVAQVYPPTEVPPTRGTRTNGFPFPLAKFLVRQSRWFLPSQHQHTGEQHNAAHHFILALNPLRHPLQVSNSFS